MEQHWCIIAFLGHLEITGSARGPEVVAACTYMFFIGAPVFDLENRLDQVIVVAHFCRGEEFIKGIVWKNRAN